MKKILVGLIFQILFEVAGSKCPLPNGRQFLPFSVVEGQLKPVFEERQTKSRFAVGRQASNPRCSFGYEVLGVPVSEVFAYREQCAYSPEVETLDQSCTEYLICDVESRDKSMPSVLHVSRGTCPENKFFFKEAKSCVAFSFATKEQHPCGTKEIETTTEEVTEPTTEDSGEANNKGTNVPISGEITESTTEESSSTSEEITDPTTEPTNGWSATTAGWQPNHTSNTDHA